MKIKGCLAEGIIVISFTSIVLLGAAYIGYIFRIIGF